MPLAATIKKNCCKLCEVLSPYQELCSNSLNNFDLQWPDFRFYILGAGVLRAACLAQTGVDTFAAQQIASDSVSIKVDIGRRISTESGRREIIL